MRSTTAPTPATTPIPVQLSACAFPAGLLPHLAMPKRGPPCTWGYYRVFHLILRLLYTGMQWKGFPIPQAAQGKPARHDTTVYKGFAQWAADGSLWQACVARVRHLAAATQRDVRGLQGDGTHTGATPGGRAVGSRGTHTSRGTPAARSATTMALCERLSLWLLATPQRGCCCPRAARPCSRGPSRWGWP